MAKTVPLEVRVTSNAKILHDALVEILDIANTALAEYESKSECGGNVYALRKAGVQIYEYTPGFVHAKVMVSDDVKAVVGTINMDYRSLYHHYECAAYLYKNTCIKNIELDFQATLDECELVTDEMVEGEKFAYKITAALAKVAAPLM